MALWGCVLLLNCCSHGEPDSSCNEGNCDLATLKALCTTDVCEIAFSLPKNVLVEKMNVCASIDQH